MLRGGPKAKHSTGQTSLNKLLRRCPWFQRAVVRSLPIRGRTSSAAEGALVVEKLSGTLKPDMPLAGALGGLRVLVGSYCTPLFGYPIWGLGAFDPNFRNFGKGCTGTNQYAGGHKDSSILYRLYKVVGLGVPSEGLPQYPFECRWVPCKSAAAARDALGAGGVPGKPGARGHLVGRALGVRVHSRKQLLCKRRMG